MKNYEYLPMSYSKDLNRIKIPKFQRSLIWSQSKKNELINTLHKDFPFGALLVAPDQNNSKELRLLDGQQRLSTINEYSHNKIKYWRVLNKDEYERTLKKINSILHNTNESKISESEFNDYLNLDFELGDWTDSYEGMAAEIKKTLRETIKKTREKIENYIELTELQIPVINFIGSEDDLPEVFENLNKGGVPLTKYEVLSATWDGQELKMPQDDENADSILEYVKRYYRSIMANGEFEIDNFSEDDIEESRIINLAEFGRALGNFVVDRIPALISSNDKAAVNELGFGLLGIITDTPNKEIVKVSSHKNLIQQNMSDNLRKINQISKKINDPFSKLLKQNISFGKNKKAKKDQYSVGLSTSFKILSKG